jgi:hypothetical protein
VCGRFDPVSWYQLEIVNESQRRFQVGKITHGQSIVVNIIDKDVADVIGVVDGQVYLYTAVGSKKVTLLHCFIYMRL